MGFVLILSNWYQMCLNHICCSFKVFLWYLPWQQMLYLYLFCIYPHIYWKLCIYWYLLWSGLYLFIMYFYCIYWKLYVFNISSYLLDWIYFSFIQYMYYKICWGKILFCGKGMLYWENNAYMYWVKELLCIKLLVAEAAGAASAYLRSVLL